MGQCGIRTGTNFFQQLVAEHSLDQEGRCPAYFHEEGSGGKTARLIMVDTDEAEISAMLAQDVARFLAIENCLFTQENSGNNFAKAKNTLVPELKDVIEDALRR